MLAHPLSGGVGPQFVAVIAGLARQTALQLNPMTLCCTLAAAIFRDEGPVLLGCGPAFGMGIAFFVTSHARDLACAALPIVAMTEVAAIGEFEISFCGGAMIGRRCPCLSVRIDGMTFCARHATQSPFKISAMTGGGAVSLAMRQDVVSMIGLGDTGVGVGELCVAAATTGSAAADGVGFLVTPQTSDGVHFQDVFDVYPVFGRVLPIGLVRKDAG